MFAHSQCPMQESHFKGVFRFLKCFSRKNVENIPENWQNDLKQRRVRHLIQISAVAKVVAKDKLALPTGTWPCI